MKSLVIYLLFVLALFGQKKSIEAVKTTTAPVVDGNIESVWDQVEWNSDFTQSDPTPMAPSTHETQFKFLYDDDNVYFLVYAYADPSTILTVGGARDGRQYSSDFISISIDPLFDKNTGYKYTVNPSNVQRDERLYGDDDDDDKWNAVWYSSTSRMSDGWVLELKIPLRDVKFQKSDVQDWGLNVSRHIRFLKETSYWQAVEPESGFRVSQFASIKNLKDLKSKNEINFVPSVVSIFDSEKDYDPFDNDRIVGLDMRYNFDEQHSILATFHPDFSQIESDDDRINISDYPLELDERRPFFLKGSNLYDTPGDLFYPRRITKPNFGAKFFGSSEYLKYGLTYVNNDGLVLDAEGDILDIPNEENFVIPRIKYLPSQSLEIGYLGGFVDSENSQSGQLHGFDLVSRPNDQWTLVGLLSTTNLNGEDPENYLLGGNFEYSTDKWEGELGFHKRSQYYNNFLIGFPEVTNVASVETRLRRRIRFQDSSFRDMTIQARFQYDGTQNFEIPTKSFRSDIRVNMNTELLGQIRYGANFNYKTGYFRNYEYSDTTKKTILYDNYNPFVGEEQSGSSFTLEFDSDFSWPIGFFIKGGIDRVKETDIYTLRNNYQFKPSESLLFRVEISIQDIQGSEFLEKETLRKINFKMNYLIAENLFVKIFTQINSDSDGFSNNLIVNYEYEKGSFVYLAYNETGNLIDGYEKGPFIENYRLERRTISLKWTYSFYY